MNLIRCHSKLLLVLGLSAFIVAVILLAYGISSKTIKAPAQTRFKRSGEDCECGPGFYVHGRCSGTQSAICSPCPSGTYNSGTDESEECSDCTHHNNCPLNAYVAVECTSTTNIVCKCNEGYEEKTHRGDNSISCFPKRDSDKDETANKDSKADDRPNNTDESFISPNNKNSKESLYPNKYGVLVFLVAAVFYNIAG